MAKKEDKKVDAEFEGFVCGHNSCAGCGCAITMRHITKAIGKDAILSIATGCMEVVSTAYPTSAWNLPIIHTAFENTAATASGIEAALKHLGKNHKVVAIAGDGGTFDIGLQALSGMAERGHDVLFICYDNEAYMNTGVQRSGSTPQYADTTTSPHTSSHHGKIEGKKSMPFIMASHGCYVATANVAYLPDLYAKIKKALSIKGPKYIQIFAPCVIGWGIPSNDTIAVSRLAVQTGVYPLYEIENGVVKMSMDIKSKPAAEYFKRQKRFKSLHEEEIIMIQQKIDSEYERLKKLSDSGIKVF
jgi:pyruvate ferredoxin oxidoreductase beta subunit